MTERSRAPGVPGGAAAERQGGSGTGAVTASVGPVSAPLGAVGAAGPPGAAGVLASMPAAESLPTAAAGAPTGPAALPLTAGAALSASPAGAVSLHFSGAVRGVAPQGVSAGGGVGGLGGKPGTPAEQQGEGKDDGRATHGASRATLMWEAVPWFASGGRFMNEEGPCGSGAIRSSPADNPPLEALTRFERFAVRLVRRMHQGRWPRVWAACQRQLGARWITALAGPLLEVHGLEQVAATSRDRPLLLAANHRSFFDLYVTMAVLYRRLPGWRATCFPVRGRYYYQRIGGVLLNALIANWAMYPPFFYEPRKRRFDQWSLGELARLCREGPGRLVGFHPEGTRNKGADPYSFLPAQPGIGRLILEARPTVVPVFIAGLPNSVGEILRRRRGGGEPIRLWFGAALALPDPLPSGPGAAAALTAEVMGRIAGLAALDRARMAGAAG